MVTDMGTVSSNVPVDLNEEENPIYKLSKHVNEKTNI